MKFEDKRSLLLITRCYSEPIDTKNKCVFMCVSDVLIVLSEWNINCCQLPPPPPPPHLRLKADFCLSRDCRNKTFFYSFPRQWTLFLSLYLTRSTKLLSFAADWNFMRKSITRATSECCLWLNQWILNNSKLTNNR